MQLKKYIFDHSLVGVGIGSLSPEFLTPQGGVKLNKSFF